MQLVRFIVWDVIGSICMLEYITMAAFAFFSKEVPPHPFFLKHRRVARMAAIVATLGLVRFLGGFIFNL